MPSIPSSSPTVIGGIDTHKDLHVAEPPVKMGRSLTMGMVVPGRSDPEPP
jgi:hypothetical protein